jgi:2-polyprenyl-3-methyl-5-hydroxy-6-metoxy-1,4-benzoquinol methylase
MNSISDVQHFDELAQEWDSLYSNELIYNDRIFVLRRWLKVHGFLSDSKEHRVLDIGCGTGQAANAYGRFLPMLVGLDISNEMLFQANAKEYALSIQYDGKSFPLRENTFDLVHMFNVIEFIEEWEKVLEQVFYMLKPNSWFFISVVNSREILIKISKIKRKLLRQPSSSGTPALKRYYTFEQIMTTLSNIGFSEVKVFMYGISPRVNASKNKSYFNLTRNRFLGSQLYIQAKKL